MAERIPEDIMREARTLALEVFHNCVDSDDGSESLDTPVAAELIATALYAERKRCAEICEHYAQQWDMGGFDGKPNDGFNACMEAACAILASKGGGE